MQLKSVPPKPSKRGSESKKSLYFSVISLLQLQHTPLKYCNKFFLYFWGGKNYP
jgi:hypothetical protein